MPFHHVTAGLLYKGNYLNRSLSAGSDSEQLANISVEELDGEILEEHSITNIGDIFEGKEKSEFCPILEVCD
ncbi:Calcium-binding protein 8 [Microtus ochrogaster]|uniref:Calcium-binding protein 8 n=1 Tax=Microtus ochrogaster TaxID=79684 RepID=A0A8J6L796_MICOH|nr:Calcium-binding protein 8 [Microtus ochrogaster]